MKRWNYKDASNASELAAVVVCTMDWPEEWDEPSYVFSAEDVALRLPQVVARVNFVDEDGLRVERVPPDNRGYGLVATREFAQDSPVTQYGGVAMNPEDAVGEYVVQVGEEGVAIDGHHGFRPDQKGRWINDAADWIYADESERAAQTRWELRNSNTDLQAHPDGTLWLYANRDIREGEELLWYYGPDYARPWVQRIEAPAPAKRGRIAAACVQCGVSAQHTQLYMCGDCGDATKVWCGQRCGLAHGHHNICPN